MQCLVYLRFLKEGEAFLQCVLYIFKVPVLFKGGGGGIVTVYTFLRYRYFFKGGGGILTVFDIIDLTIVYCIHFYISSVIFLKYYLTVRRPSSLLQPDGNSHEMFSYQIAGLGICSSVF